MKLFMVIYVGGLVGGTIGPLPYDMDECERRMAEISEGKDDALRKYSVTFACEFHNERPKGDPSLGEAFQPPLQEGK